MGFAPGKAVGSHIRGHYERILNPYNLFLSGDSLRVSIGASLNLFYFTAYWYIVLGEMKRPWLFVEDIVQKVFFCDFFFLLCVWEHPHLKVCFGDEYDCREKIPLCCQKLNSVLTSLQMLVPYNKELLTTCSGSCFWIHLLLTMCAWLSHGSTCEVTCLSVLSVPAESSKIFRWNVDTDSSKGQGLNAGSLMDSSSNSSYVPCLFPYNDDICQNIQIKPFVLIKVKQYYKNFPLFQSLGR